MRSVIIHSHLFKNAGSSFDWALQKNFGESFLDHRDDKNMMKGADYLEEFIGNNPDLNAISSHHVKFPLPEINDIQFLPVILLRHPIDRVGSVYSFEKQQVSDSLGAVAAKKMTFKEYVKWRLLPNIPIAIRNFQTSRCLDVPTTIKTMVTRPLREADFNNALQRINDLMLLGIVDLYDESMVLFEEALRPYFPQVDLSYKRQNVTSDRKKSMEDRVNAIYKELGLELANRLLVENCWDLKLYTEARTILVRRMEKMENFSDKLVEFRARCIS